MNVHKYVLALHGKQIYQQDGYLELEIQIRQFFFCRGGWFFCPYQATTAKYTKEHTKTNKK